MAAQRTLNPLIQVRILVPRPLITKALNKKEEINPDRYCTRPFTGIALCDARVFSFKWTCVSMGGLLKEKAKELLG
jgi:hypothetical protein